MYRKVEQMNLPKSEEEILKFWKENNVKQKCLENNFGNKEFVFYEGPPTANGQPHAGHMLTRSLKDVFTRYKSMQGYFVPRKGGWDTHGLPVELAVEKEIGISGKQQIEEYGVEKFIKKCKENVWLYADLWKEFSNRVGYFVNMENDFYVTYEDNYIESCWWAIKELDKKGLLYKGYKIQPSCPHCGTALSSHEVAQGYKDRNDLTVVAKFKSVDMENTHFLAWTTTPWTLPSNIALCTNPKEEYVKIKSGNENYILAKALVSSHFKEGEYEILESYKGKDLEGKKYIPLFDFANENQKQNGYYITCDNYVVLTEGTGIVHIAPAYGEDDSKVGKKYNLPFLQFTNQFGKFTENCKEYAGKDCFDENENIAKDLRNQGKIFKQAKHTHSYPHCWRCGSPLIYFARDSWFVKTTQIKNELQENNQSVNWLPETIKNGRMGNWLENCIDWGISRDRYWGTPLPVWKCECGHYHTIGSKEELKQLANLKSDVELHKPYIDQVTFPCPKCKKTMHREKEVIDCWFDSGAMPFAQFHYPFENKDLFEKRFPADFISEGVDQCRGWFYTLQILGTALFNKSPYKTCIANGLVVDEKGQKLSKSLGNYTPPMELLDSVGADAVRWGFYTQGQPWSNLAMTPNVARETYKNFFGSLYNTYAFYVLYAEIDKFNPNDYELKNCKLTVMDIWILNELDKLILYVENELDNFHCTESSRAIQEYVDKLSNWYIRRCRERFWVGDMTDDKIAAFKTLHNVLDTLAKLLAPFTPFLSEEIYQNITKNVSTKTSPISVHLCSFPKANSNKINEKLSQDMNLVYTYAELGRSARTLANLKIRQPLQTLYLTDAKDKTTLSEELINILKDELNIKKVIQNSNLDKFVSYSLKPQLKTLGPKYGKLLGEIQKFLANCNADEIVKQVKSGETYKTSLNGNEVEFKEEDLLINILQKEGYVSATQNHLAIIYDANLTNELIEEGIVREFISKIQALRKTSNFNVTDRITIYVEGEKSNVNLILKNKETICPATLCTCLEEGSATTFQDTLTLENFNISFSIKKN